MKKRAVFLDRDGTIIKEKNYLRDANQIELLEGSAQALRLIQKMGFKLIIITNQSGIKRGIIRQKNLIQIHAQLKRMLANKGVTIDAIYYSPDLPNEKSTTRKPNTGLLEKAERDFGLSLKNSYCIGDKKEDIDMGMKKKMVTILVLTGYGNIHKTEVSSDYIANNLMDAAKWIKSREKVIKKQKK